MESEPEEEPKVIHTVNFDDLKPIEHRWIDRGEVMSCEDAGHPNHRHFKLGSRA